MRQLITALVLAAALVPAGVHAGQTPQTPKPAWPSVERQLAADRVAPETALARLIRANQDFALLRPEEAHDRLPVPLWLRVWWRKAHPDSAYSAADPTGGYPFVLKEVHEWMVSHPDLKGDRSGPIQAESAEGKRKKPPKPTVTVETGPEQNISGERGSPRSESAIRINFWNPDQILGAANDIQGSGTMAIFYSGDGGATWRAGATLPKQGESFQSDPAVEWTSDGTAWATAIAVDSGAAALHGRTWRSSDGGATWKFDGNFSGDQTRVDKQMTWVDHFEESPYRDNLYAIWHNNEEVFVNHRSGPDGGWGEPVQVSGGETTGTGIGSDIRTNSQGTVFAFWPDTGSQKIFVARSTDGGESFSRPLSIAKTAADFDISLPAQFRRNVLVYVTGGAFFRGNKKNFVYAAWTDLAGGRGCSSRDEQPNQDRESPCTVRIWFARSTNGGNTWSRPEMINDRRDLNDQFNPWLTVDEATGNLAIAYYDTYGEERTRTNLWVQASTDDGASWSAAYRVTAESTNENEGLPNGNQYGDYNGLSGHAGVFFPSWTDRRGGIGVKEQIWTAPLSIALKAAARTPGNLCPFQPFVPATADWSPEQLTQQPVCTP
jgi:hypothetical protein